MDEGHYADMRNQKLARMDADFALLLARHRAKKQIPFTPAWDAAIRDVEDLEREVFRLASAVVGDTPRATIEPCHIAATPS